MEKTIKAVQFAENAHIGQTRKVTGLPYIAHCFNVYSIVKQNKSNDEDLDEVCAVCILHDCLEDTDTTPTQLREMFGDIVANTVIELTNDRDQIAKIGKEKYINEKLMQMSDYALAIKLGDMLANITDSPTSDMLQRVENHVKFLKQNRKLTAPQAGIIKNIERVLMGIYLQTALMDRD